MKTSNCQPEIEEISAANKVAKVLFSVNSVVIRVVAAKALLENEKDSHLVRLWSGLSANCWSLSYKGSNVLSTAMTNSLGRGSN